MLSVIWRFFFVLFLFLFLFSVKICEILRLSVLKKLTVKC